MIEGWGYELAVFWSSFLAATLLPGGSEVVVALASAESNSPATLILLLATVGNTLGGMTSYLIGRVLPNRREKPQVALERVQRYGTPVLLLSWVPFVGDPLCVAAGWLRVNWVWALAYMGVGKGVRYAFIIWLV